MKVVGKIVGVIVLFIGLGYAITYPYELSYSGSDDIILIEDSYSFSTISDIINRKEFKNKVLYIDVSEPFDRSFEKEMKLKYDSFPSLIEEYENKNIVFVYLVRPDSDSRKKEDDFRKWIYGIKYYNLKGYHAIMSPPFYYKLIEDFPEINQNWLLPHNMIVNQDGEIVDRNAPAPNETEKLYPVLNKLLSIN